MREIQGNMFIMYSIDAICITTNGFVKKGQCIMGRGNAKMAKIAYPGIARKLGSLIRKNGNCVQPIIQDGSRVVLAFPVKPIDFM